MILFLVVFGVVLLVFGVVYPICAGFDADGIFALVMSWVVGLSLTFPIFLTYSSQVANAEKWEATTSLVDKCQETSYSVAQEYLIEPQVDLNLAENQNAALALGAVLLVNKCTDVQMKQTELEGRLRGVAASPLVWPLRGTMYGIIPEDLLEELEH